MLLLYHTLLKKNIYIYKDKRQEITKPWIVGGFFHLKKDECGEESCLLQKVILWKERTVRKCVCVCGWRGEDALYCLGLFLLLLSLLLLCSTFANY